MLSSLKIQNYALIRNLDIDFSDRLSIITGETGTGKSIMLGALGLILGNRADTSVLLDQGKKCVVEGRFDIRNYRLKRFFEKNDLDWEEISILRREISPGGKSRAFVNDTPVNLNILKELGEKLIDIHSQHQTLKLSNPVFQLSLLDAYAGHQELTGEYSSLFRQYKSDHRTLNDLHTRSSQLKKEYDYNVFQLEEITKASLQPDEQEILDEELNLLTNADVIRQNLQQAVFSLYDDERSIHGQLSILRKQFSQLSALNSHLQQFYNRLESLSIEVKDLYNEIDGFSDTVSVDNRRLEEINTRLLLINNLLHKHQCRTIAELLSNAEEIRAKINSADNLSDEISILEKKIGEDELRLLSLATKISEGRKKQVDSLQINLMSLLKQVGIPDAVIQIELRPLPSLSDTGKDQANILFSANKGSKPGLVSEVASGGELSRLMLCFKYILADTIFLPTIIFDEIDTGVSGEVAIKVGQMVRKLASNHQVITITHQPQVAAIGNHHYVVFKKSGSDFTETHIRQLSSDERIEEIAKMIAGHKPSQVAIENAKELLGIAG